MTEFIKKALVSEKSFREVAAGKVTFVVDKRATKEEIAKNCAELFKVTVLDVNTTNIIGKVKRTKKGMGKRSDYKKAIITLKKGDKIDLFEIEEEEKKDQKSKSASKQVSK
ncbi:MAG: 50S ribosomal protein L23 [Patescibacteria group bacterium]